MIATTTLPVLESREEGWSCINHFNKPTLQQTKIQTEITSLSPSCGQSRYYHVRFCDSTVNNIGSIPVEDDSDMGSPGVDKPPSPDYVPGPEEPVQAPPSPVYLPYVLERCTSVLYHRGEEDDEEDPEEDPADYPANRRDDDDNDDDDEEEEDEEEEEDLAPADYTVVALPVVDHVPSEEETKPFKTDECAATPPSPLIPYSSLLPQIPSPPLPIPSPPPNSPTHNEVLESYLPFWKRLRFAAPTPNHEVRKSSAAGAARQDGLAVAKEDPYSIARGDLYRFFDRVDVAPGCLMSKELDYGITDTWDDLVGAIKEIALTTLEGVNQRVTNLSTTVKQDTTIMYGIMEDVQDDRSLLRARDKLLYRDRLVHRRLVETGVIKELLAADHQRQVKLTKALKLLKGLQTQMAEFQSYAMQPVKYYRLFPASRLYRSFVLFSYPIQKMAPKRRTTRLNPGATPTLVTDTHTTTSVTNAQIQAMINEGVTTALAARDATKNGDDSHTSGSGARRPMQVARECTYPDFLKCQPLNFKGTEGVVGLL
ncbi:hypothetical protein Tco_0251060 [Tanacetum coccineum]